MHDLLYVDFDLGLAPAYGVELKEVAKLDDYFSKQTIHEKLVERRYSLLFFTIWVMREAI